MDRRKFLKTTGVAAGAVTASTLAAPAVLAQQGRELRMVTSWPKNFPGLGTAPEYFADKLREVSDGRFNIRVFGGGELVPPLQVHDAVQEGTADLYHSADYYFVGKAPGYGFFSTVPMGMTTNEMDAWLRFGGGQQLWDNLGSNFGIKHLPCGSTGTQMGGWFQRPIDSIEDFRGLRMRIPGFGGDVITELGGTPVTLAGAEILPAMQAGTIDAVEWVGPWNDQAFGLHRVWKNYATSGFHEPGLILSLGIGQALWDSLSAADQALWASVAHDAHNWSYAQYNANNQVALENLVNNEGVNLFSFSEEMYAALSEATKDVMSALGSRDAQSQEVYDSFYAFRAQTINYWPIAEQGFMNMRAKVGV